MRAVLAAALLPLAAALAACGGDAPAPPAVPADSLAQAAAAVPGVVTALDVAREAPGLATFADLAARSGFDAVLADTALALTVFAPSTAAFEALPAGRLDALRADPAAARALLEAHTLAVRTFASDVDLELDVDPLAGPALGLRPDGAGGVTVTRGGVSARVETPDLDAENGVVHVVDAVLLP